MLLLCVLSFTVILCVIFDPTYLFSFIHPKDSSSYSNILDIDLKLLGAVLAAAGFSFAAVRWRQQNIQMNQSLFSNGVSQLGDEKVAIRCAGVAMLIKVAIEDNILQEHIIRVLYQYLKNYASSGFSVTQEVNDIIKAFFCQNSNDKKKPTGAFYLKSPLLQKVDLRGAYLRGAKLEGAHLSEADLTGASLWEADLTNADLREVNLTRANLRVENCQWIILKNATLSGARLSREVFQEALPQEVSVQGVNLEGVNLSGLDLSNLDLTEADLRVENCQWITLTNATLSGARLSRALFEEALRQNVDVRGVNLRGVDLSSLDLSNLDLTEADLSGLVLRGVDLSGATIEIKWKDSLERQGTILSGVTWVDENGNGIKS